ncbi:prophage LambdaW5, minor tail protein Z [Pseudovibrio sp. FO-BEG1]|uniref:phage tail protein n=1 Tax=Pseudovibrio sp. (strain FO-BEG1) TaxID=911045 RepID=UPI000238D38B|nr:phage tail protein [Pseudovibrio sp. FO-BEG1]AEV37543.1 prophage LambdaW5, minor tail protein Z [Pseudovibrio sp. FO-BEG1]
MFTVSFDTRDLDDLMRGLGNLSGDIKGKAIARALKHTTAIAKTRVVRKSAASTGMRQKDIRSVTVAVNTGADIASVIMRSGWIPLYQLGSVRQTRDGVSVRNWGTHQGTFLATMASGHTGVFKRSSAARLPVRELWGPNPAADVQNHEDEFMDVLEDVADEKLRPRLEHEIDRLLSSL